MKKVLLILLAVVLIFLFGCTPNEQNTEDPANTPTADEQSNVTDPPAPIELQNSQVDGYLIGRRNFAAKNENGDVYFIANKCVGKIDASGEVSILFDGFQFGHDIAVHNQWIYTLRGITLYRTDKNGENEYEYPLLFDRGVNSIYICGDVLYVDITNAEGHVEYYCADITDDPNTLEFMPESNKFDRESFIGQVRLDFPEESLEEFEKYARVHAIEVTDKYGYFFTLNNELGRINRETQQVELLPIKPYQVEKTAFIDGWIYYKDDSNIICRTSEDLSKTEKIYQDGLNTLD
ncbi:MAG: hypothetical protein J1F23_04130 [Oscillospiraceae bacterium]|nr:hypothetical protein [Oscillospiraceae bacterium]